MSSKQNNELPIQDSQSLNETDELVLRFNEEYKTSKSHVDGQNSIPEVICGALIEAETNSRLNNGDVRAIASINHGEKLLEIPDFYEGEELCRYLWDLMMDAGGQSVHFSFATNDERLSVIFLCHDAGYVATASISHEGDTVNIGDWQVSPMPLKSQGVGIVKECFASHRWIVFSTAIADGCLMLNCRDCGAMGTVDDPSSEEWSNAFHAPTTPYSWDDESRVSVRQQGPVYVKKATNSDSSGRIKPPSKRLTQQELVELTSLEELVIEASLDGRLFPLFLHSFQQNSGREVCGATKRLASQVEKLVAAGRCFTPAMMGIVIREYIRESGGLPPATDDRREC